MDLRHGSPVDNLGGSHVGRRLGVQIDDFNLVVAWHHLGRVNRFLGTGGFPIRALPASDFGRLSIVVGNVR